MIYGEMSGSLTFVSRAANGIFILVQSTTRNEDGCLCQIAGK